MIETRGAVFVATLTLSLVPAISAQEFDLNFREFLAFSAVMSTPIGALPPVATPAMSGASLPRFAVRAQYGYLGLTEDMRVNAFGGGLDVAVGSSTIGLTVAQWNPSCPQSGPPGDECESHLMFGANWATSVLSASAASSRASFNLGLDANAGFARPDVGGNADQTLWTVAVGMPILVSGGTGRMRITPFLTPRFVWTRVAFSFDDPFGAGGQSEEHKTGALLMLGGGVGVSGVVPGLGLTFGFQRVQRPAGLDFVGTMQYGLGATIAFGR